MTIKGRGNPPTTLLVRVITREREIFMKIKGKKLKGPYVKTVVLPRDGEDLVFEFRAILDDKEFYKLCPAPEPPTKLFPGGVKRADVENPKFKEALDAWSLKKVYWQFLTSISITEDLEWETVDMEKPDTWENYVKELTKVLPEPEQLILMQAYTEVQGLDQEKINQATKSFLAGRQVEKKR